MKKWWLLIATFSITVAGCASAGDHGAGATGSDASAGTGTTVSDGHLGGDGGANLGSGTDGSVAGVGPYFSTPMFFNVDVSGVGSAANSAALIKSLDNAGGWGDSNKLQIDFSIQVLTADASTPKKTFTPNGDFSTPDCDNVPMPVPAVGHIEDETGYACTGGGDCHLLVNDAADHKLYEMYEADLEGSTFTAGCQVVWNTNTTYGPDLRGEQCTSTDAAGFPVAPLLFTADEVAAGEINHAIRFILPNNRVQQGFVRPATHGTRTTGGSGAPSYGVHLRLRADYPLATLSTGAQVVARAMQKYGMYHADGGNIALTAEDDTYTTAKWAGLLGARDLAALTVDDFEVIDHGAPIPLTLDCVRN